MSITLENAQAIRPAQTITVLVRAGAVGPHLIGVQALQAKVDLASPQEILLRAGGRTCWFPRAALTPCGPRNPCFQLAHWFRPSGDVAAFLEAVSDTTSLTNKDIDLP